MVDTFQPPSLLCDPRHRLFVILVLIIHVHPDFGDVLVFVNDDVGGEVFDLLKTLVM